MREVVQAWLGENHGSTQEGRETRLEIGDRHAEALCKEEVLAQLNMADRASLLETCRTVRDLVKSAGLDPSSCNLQLKDFMGSPERLAWALQHGQPMDDTVCPRIAKFGAHLDVLKWAVSKGLPFNGEGTIRNIIPGTLPQEHGTIRELARAGRVEHLRWAHQAGFDINMKLCMYCATYYGHLEILNYLWEVDPGKIDPDIWQVIWKLDPLEPDGDFCERWVRENPDRAEHHPHELDNAWFEHCHFGLSNPVEAWASAGKHGHIELLRWGEAVGALQTWKLSEVDFMFGDDNCAFYLTKEWATTEGGFECLQFVHERLDVPLNSEDLIMAVYGGIRIECVL